MGYRSTADGSAAAELNDRALTSPPLIVIGLGPGDLARMPAVHRDLLLDADTTVVVRTLRHPASQQLAELRPVVSCDDLYDSEETFDDVYQAIADRVTASAQAGRTIYAVPGSPLVGEFAVGKLLASDQEVELIPSESFVDAILATVGYDPLERGLRIMNGHELPDPLVLDAPTIIGHLDAPAVLADVCSSLSRVLPEGAQVTLCSGIGAADARVLTVSIDEVPADLGGFRTSLFIDTEPAGLFGLVGVSRRLRDECPWDREQTHASLVTHLMEEVAELAEALAALPPEDDGQPDFVAYDGVEEELGDVLLQVLFHANIAAESGAFGIDDVATRLREKLVRRHPHVFGNVVVDGADEVSTNWDRIKEREKGGPAGSLMDGIPAGMAVLERAVKMQRRAAKVGFDWETAGQVLTALSAEIVELKEALSGRGEVADELGDVLFSAVNLARHLGVDPELALRRTSARFEQRFRAMEAEGPLEGLDLAELERRWASAKESSG